MVDDVPMIVVLWEEKIMKIADIESSVKKQRLICEIAVNLDSLITSWVFSKFGSPCWFSSFVVLISTVASTMSEEAHNSLFFCFSLKSSAWLWRKFIWCWSCSFTKWLSKNSDQRKQVLACKGEIGRIWIWHTTFLFYWLLLLISWFIIQLIFCCLIS